MNKLAAPLPKRWTPRWAYRWFYWNTGFYRIAPRLGMKLKKFDIKDPIIVYQMGKVGSTTIYSSLKRLELDVPVYQLHYLDDLARMEEVMLARAPQNARGIQQQLEQAKQVRHAMTQKPKQKWNFITLTRLPIPRLISAFFQMIEGLFPNVATRYENGELTMQELTTYFVNTFADHTPLEWFQRQIQRPFGFNIYAIPFDYARGYQIYTHENMRLLLMRLEDLNRVAPTALSDFLNLPDFKLVNRNVGESKKSGVVYRDFLDSLRLPRTLVEEWHTSQYARHFYTPEELEASIARWV